MKRYLSEIRAEKTHTIKDDFRVIIAGVVFCILLLMFQSTVMRLYDTYIAERPFISATLSIVHVNEDLPPLIQYDADPIEPVAGTWIAKIYDENGIRQNSRRGEGIYVVQEDDPNYWSWSAFFDNENSDPPTIPDFPFYICVRYSVTTQDTGVLDETENFCSNLYDPNDPNLVLFNALTLEEIIR